MVVPRQDADTGSRWIPGPDIAWRTPFFGRADLLSVPLQDLTEGLRTGNLILMENRIFLVACPNLFLALRRENTALPNALAEYFRPPFISVLSDRSHDYAQGVICAGLDASFCQSQAIKSQAIKKSKGGRIPLEFKEKGALRRRIKMMCGADDGSRTRNSFRKADFHPTSAFAAAGFPAFVGWTVPLPWPPGRPQRALQRLQAPPVQSLHLPRHSRAGAWLGIGIGPCLTACPLSFPRI